VSSTVDFSEDSHHHLSFSSDDDDDDDDLSINIDNDIYVSDNDVSEHGRRSIGWSLSSSDENDYEYNVYKTFQSSSSSNSRSESN